MAPYCNDEFQSQIFYVSDDLWVVKMNFCTNWKKKKKNRPKCGKRWKWPKVNTRLNDGVDKRRSTIKNILTHRHDRERIEAWKWAKITPFSLWAFYGICFLSFYCQGSIRLINIYSLFGLEGKSLVVGRWSLVIIH